MPLYDVLTSFLNLGSGFSVTGILEVFKLIMFTYFTSLKTKRIFKILDGSLFKMLYRLLNLSSYICYTPLIQKVFLLQTINSIPLNSKVCKVWWEQHFTSFEIVYEAHFLETYSKYFLTGTIHSQINSLFSLFFLPFFSFLHCYHQRKIRWLERDLNSHLRVSRPPIYPLSYRVNGDWWRVSNLSGRNVFATTWRLSWRTRSVSILFQSHPQRYEKLISWVERWSRNPKVRVQILLEPTIFSLVVAV